jgi:hypothetical protein
MQHNPKPTDAYHKKFILAVVLSLLATATAKADLQKHVSKDYVLDQITQWRSEIDSKTNLSAMEKHKELDFVSKLQNRLEQEVSTDLTSKNIKTELEFIQKTNLKGSNPLFVTDSKFVDQSIILIDQLEPTENPIIVLRKYLFFASIEKTKPVSEFQNSRSYINHGASVTADPDDLDDAADYVENKIFSHHEADGEML